MDYDAEYQNYQTHPVYGWSPNNVRQHGPDRSNNHFLLLHGPTNVNNRRGLALKVSLPSLK